MPNASKWPDDFLQLRSPGINFYVLRDASGLFLIDGGFIGGPKLLAWALKKCGWQHEPVRGIVVTHGHLDHILNVGWLAKRYGAWIAAPRLDAAYYVGRPRYTGWSRITGVLEALGRTFLGFQRFTPDRLLDDGDQIDIWQGLEAVHLPGHTPGHMGFYCRKLRLMFTGDLIVSYRGRAWYPPYVLNTDAEQNPKSAERVLTFDLDGVIPNHCDRWPASEHLRRLKRLLGREPD